jgi:hypothetical protein
MPDLELEQEPVVKAHLIKQYGELWNPEYVDWARSWKLLGKRSKGSKSSDINVYEERGIYVLYNDYTPVYVGKALQQSIGYRLQLHRESSRKGTRWDAFSWFGFCGLRPDGDVKKLNLHVGLKTTAAIEMLEALLITVIDPRLNSKKETLKGATRLFQSKTDSKPDFHDRFNQMEELLREISKGKK